MFLFTFQQLGGSSTQLVTNTLPPRLVLVRFRYVPRAASVTSDHCSAIKYSTVYNIYMHVPSRQMHRHVACKNQASFPSFLFSQKASFFFFLFFFSTSRCSSSSFFPSFRCSTIVSEEGWLSEVAYCIYVLYLMHMYGCTYPNRIIFYVRTYVYTRICSLQEGFGV